MFRVLSMLHPCSIGRFGREIVPVFRTMVVPLALGLVAMAEVFVLADEQIPNWQLIAGEDQIAEIDELPSEPEPSPPRRTVTRQGTSLLVAADFVRCHFRSARTLEGKLIDAGEVTIRIAGHPIRLPMAAIFGIRFGESAAEDATLVLRNGNILRGQMQDLRLRVMTAWGEIEANAGNVVDIVTDERVEWYGAETPRGTRWRIRRRGTPGHAVPTPQPILPTTIPAATPDWVW